MRTQVAIVGAGPAGMLLGELLHRQGIHSVILEKHSRAHVLGRIRAGVLEPSTVDVLRANGLAERMDRDGHAHDGMKIVWAGRHSHHIDIRRHLGKRFVAYGQSALQEDLYAAADRRGAEVEFECEGVELSGIDDAAPLVKYASKGEARSLACDYIAGCDGFHGVSRRSIPPGVLREYGKIFPFAWLGILAEVPPLPDIVYCNHPRGFALASMRNPRLSRYYVQAALDETVEDWPDGRVWEELRLRYPPEYARAIVSGPSIEKSLTPLRSYVAEPMRYGRLFLAGDAAHIVPPTGAKGLNLAVSDVYYLARALSRRYRDGEEDLLEAYSETALRRVWASVRISWHLTHLLHRFPGASDFDQRIQETELALLRDSPRAQAALAEQYAGLPLEG